MERVVICREYENELRLDIEVEEWVKRSVTGISKKVVKDSFVIQEIGRVKPYKVYVNGKVL